MSIYNRLLTPDEDELRNAPLLDDWYLYPRGRVNVLVGKVTGHPRVPDGPVTTSAVVAHDTEIGWARTRNRAYRLGRPYERRQTFLDGYIEAARAEGRLIPATVPSTVPKEQPGELPPLEDAPEEPQGWPWRP